MSNRQTVFFLPVRPKDKHHKGPEPIDLTKPRLARYMQKAWKRHQDPVYWVDISLAQRKGLKFYQTRTNAIILNYTLPACCIPKIIKMDIGEIKNEKEYESPRQQQKIVLKQNWVTALGSEIVQQDESSRPTKNANRVRTGTHVAPSKDETSRSSHNRTMDFGSEVSQHADGSQPTKAKPNLVRTVTPVVVDETPQTFPYIDIDFRVSGLPQAENSRVRELVHTPPHHQTNQNAKAHHTAHKHNTSHRHTTSHRHSTSHRHTISHTTRTTHTCILLFVLVVVVWVWWVVGVVCVWWLVCVVRVHHHETNPHAHTHTHIRTHTHARTLFLFRLMWLWFAFGGSWLWFGFVLGGCFVHGFATEDMGRKTIPGMGV